MRESNKKYKVAIQSVFLARENILFLKEWLLYNMEIGVDHFYLYDNTGSKGRNGSTKTSNRYGIPFAEITGGMTDQDVQKILQDILNEFPGRITYVKWTPKNKQGKIIYGWNGALLHYAENYGRDVEWTCFMDMDEFIFSAGKKDLKELLDAFDGAGCADIKLRQKKFEDRFYNMDKHVIQIVKCVEGIGTTGYGTKHIVKTERLDLDALRGKTRKWNMHMIPVKNANSAWAKIEDLRFNHYNTNKKQLELMKRIYKTTREFSLNGTDGSMERYWHIFEATGEENFTADLLKRFPSTK